MRNLDRFGWLKWLGVSVLVVLLDLSSKHYFESNFQRGETRYVTPFFNWVLAHNPGAAFSFLADQSGWQRPFLIVLILLITAGLLWMLQANQNDRWLRVALPLVIGGALGNLHDRVVHGHVIDFIQLHVAGYYWPAFNVADSAIFVGAAMLIIDSFRKPREKSS